MPHLEFDRQVTYTPEQMFDLVADLGAYPDFVPNCQSMHIVGDEPVCEARMSVRFGPFFEAYTSRVTLDRKRMEISAVAVDGPFSHLNSIWAFSQSAAGTNVHFDVDFAFANKLLAIAADPAFAAKQKEIVNAFISEAKRRYG